MRGSGRGVFDQAFSCSNCSRDVRALKASGYVCGNGSHKGNFDS